MRRTKAQKGITLVALIITIIVLLILAVVTINAVVDDGIIKHAKNATSKYEEKADEENTILDSYLAKIEENIPGGSSSVTGNVTWKDNGDGTITSSNGVTLKIGDYVDYDPTLEAKESDLKYTSLSEKTGTDSNQEFDAATYKNAGYGWRVLGVENGKIRLISEEFVGAGTYTDSNRTYYTLYGKKGYINGIDELNNISAIFGHGKGAESAKSITVDDINAITGYDPTVAKYGEGNFYEYGNKVTYTRGEGSELSSSTTNGQTWSGTQATFNYYDKEAREFKELTSGSVDITSTAYWYNACTLGTSNIVIGTDGNQPVEDIYNLSDEYKMIFGYNKIGTDNQFRDFTNGTVGQNYWLASDYVNAYGSYVDWGLRSVGVGGVNRNDLYDSDDIEDSDSYGVRPVVSLKSDISLEWNETAKEWKIK